MEFNSFLLRVSVTRIKSVFSSIIVYKILRIEVYNSELVSLIRKSAFRRRSNEICNLEKYGLYRV